VRWELVVRMLRKSQKPSLLSRIQIESGSTSSGCSETAWGISLPFLKKSVRGQGSTSRVDFNAPAVVALVCDFAERDARNKPIGCCIISKREDHHAKAFSPHLGISTVILRHAWFE
jgi:hypothetical protein